MTNKWVKYEIKRQEIREQVFDIMLEFEINWMPVGKQLPKKLINALMYYWGGLIEFRTENKLLTEVEYTNIVNKN